MRHINSYGPVYRQLSQTARTPPASCFACNGGAGWHLLWGGQSCPQPPFRRLLRDLSEPARGKNRLKAGCSQDWLPHYLGGIFSTIKNCAALGFSLPVPARNP